MLEDTIAAISTPIAEGGIAIVRLSGIRAFAIAKKIFPPKTRKKKIKNREINYGFIRDPFTGKTVEEVLITWMKSPKTYTREDVVEINCHGGFLPARKILQIVLKSGARLAEPGEFTKRAFLNGRIDLIQAEAIADFIRARADKALEMSFRQLKGELSKGIERLRMELKDLIAHMEVNIDYPDEDIKHLTKHKIRSKINDVEKKFSTILETADSGRALKEGIKVGIIGRPNVGKSSLLNKLLAFDRAIVTPVPGTTRDTLEEALTLEGIPLSLVDTAGIRETKEIVEKEGVYRSQKVLQDADIILLILDGSEALKAGDKELIKSVNEKKTIIVINKIDLPRKVFFSEVLSYTERNNIVEISAIKGLGIEKLKDKIKRKIFDFGLLKDNVLKISNIRQIELLRQGRDFLTRAKKASEKGLTEEFISHDLVLCLELLDQMIGKTTREDIINQIFSQFCLGK